jgi:hypothetical protein
VDIEEILFRVELIYGLLAQHVDATDDFSGTPDAARDVDLPERPAGAPHFVESRPLGSIVLQPAVDVDAEVADRI